MYENILGGEGDKTAVHVHSVIIAFTEFHLPRPHPLTCQKCAREKNNHSSGGGYRKYECLLQMLF